MPENLVAPPADAGPFSRPLSADRRLKAQKGGTETPRDRGKRTAAPTGEAQSGYKALGGAKKKAALPSRTAFVRFGSRGVGGYWLAVSAIDSEPSSIGMR